MRTKMIYNPACHRFCIDTPSERKEIFEWLREWNGYSDFDEATENLAHYCVSDVRDYLTEDDLTVLELEMPILVYWEPERPANKDQQMYRVARFCCPRQALDFAQRLNTETERQFVGDDKNFSAVQLPDSSWIDLGKVMRGKYPNTYQITYCLRYVIDGYLRETDAQTVYYKSNNNTVDSEKLVEALEETIKEIQNEV